MDHGYECKISNNIVSRKTEKKRKLCLVYADSLQKTQNLDFIKIKLLLFKHTVKKVQNHF